MPAIRQLLWIGSGEGLARDRVTEAPTLDVTWVRDTEEALALPAARFDAWLVEERDPDAALARVRTLRRRRGPPLLIRLPGHCGDRVPELLSAGAADVLLAGNDDEDDDDRVRRELVERVDRLASGRTWNALQSSEPPEPAWAGILGRSAAMRRVFALAERAASSRATVLLCGETGTGKELLARAIHDRGERRRGPFVALNCAAFPDSLLESELFGHVRGSFTGAERDKPGLFEVAGGGTIFLDEIAETSPAIQAKLLRVLQEREVRRVGGEQPKRVDVRVVAASNRDLRAAAESGAFREDLYYRLAVFPIAVTPLRDRRDDVLPLAEHFLARHGEREAKPGCRLSNAAAHVLLAHRWPGNVRELENEMQRALALAEPGETISPVLLSERLTALVEPVAAAAGEGTLKDALDRIEAYLIRRSLERNGGRKTRTAKQLGVTREGLYKKIKRLGIE